MPVLTRRDDFPNLLLISGDDLVTEGDDGLVGSWRTVVKDLLFSDSNGVRNFAGEVDFILCYVNRGSALDHSGIDHSVAPRPLRGIIRLPGKDLRPGVMGKLSGHEAHEVGHYWLVPGGGQIVTSSGTIPTPTPNEIAQSLNRGRGLPPYPIMGRQDSHWSPYADSRNSPMDGINHDTILPGLEALDGYTRTRGTENSGVPFYLDGEAFTTTSQYSDFELFLMGILAPPAFVPSDAYLEFIRARWVYPLDFDCGLFVECEDGQCWYLGFHRGPNQVAARSLDESTSRVASLRAPFDPRDLVGVRAIQRDGLLTFQARFFPAPDYAEGCLYEWLRRLGARFVWDPKLRKPRTSLSAADVLGNVSGSEAPTDAGNAQGGWTTLATYAGRAAKIGIGGRHLDKECFARFKADVFVGSGGTAGPLDLADFTRVNAVDQEHPFFAKTMLPDGSFVLPYSIAAGDHVVLNHTPNEDLAPRLVMSRSSPADDFAFGAQIQLLESAITTWAGGRGVGKTFIGHRQRIRFDEFDFAAAWGEFTEVRRAAPPDNTYRFLFCFLSRAPLAEEELVPKLQGLDFNRRGWESCFRELTLGQRLADTAIP
jgi:hypothetical protein